MSRKIFCICFLLIVLMMLSACTLFQAVDAESESDVELVAGDESAIAAQQDSVPTYSVFSWHDDVFTPQAREDMINSMNEHGIDSVYQWFSSDVDDADISEFAQTLHDEGLSTYVLTGDASWAKEDVGVKKMQKIIDRAIAIGNVKGVVIDIEPGQLDEYNEDPQAVMEEFTEVLISSYEYAKEQMPDFEVIICISAHWDEYSELRDMIKDACDTVCVMNYYVDAEFETILSEAEYAKLYGKKLINASEIQPPEDHGLSDANTYYNFGLGAMENAWEELADELEEEIGLTDISFSYHHYGYLDEIEE